jgi:hypothetical protein
MDLTRLPLIAGQVSAFGAVLLIAACSSTASPSTLPTSTPLPAATASTLPTSTPLPAATASTSPTPVVWDPAVDVFGPGGAGTAFGSATPTTSPLAAWVADGIERNFLFHGDYIAARRRHLTCAIG